MKKLLVLMLAFMMIFAFAACGGDDEPADDPVQQEQGNEDPVQQDPADDEQQADLPPEAEGWLATKTGKFYSQFAGEMYIEYEMEYEGQTMSIISATSGSKVYSETSIDGVNAGVTIMDGRDMYTIDHASKMVIKMSMEMEDPSQIAANIIEEEDVSVEDIKKGTREVDGKKYDTEEFEVDGAASIMCFDGDDLAYIIGAFDGEEIVMKVITTSAKVDSKLFEIPEDYQMMEF